MLMSFIAKRLLQLIPLVIAISIIIFIIIQLPPGDYLTTYIQQLKLSGAEVNVSYIQTLTKQYALDQPLYMQYFIWMKNIITQGDFGQSFQWNMPVTRVLSDKLGNTMMISLISLVIVWAIGIPVGIYSATHQYSIGDYIFSFLGFIGQSIPGFLLAMILLVIIFQSSGVLLTGLNSDAYVNQPMSWGKLWDMLPRLGLVSLIIGLSSTAGMIRQMRGMVLDELQKQYVITARSKGLKESRVLWKYPIRLAINPMISTIGWTLPGLISGEMIVSIILNMPTMGPIIQRALMSQDMYLAGSILLITSVLTVIGTLLSDILLAVIDPRIKFGGVAE